jgi:hypothetical protein
MEQPMHWMERLLVGTAMVLTVASVALLGSLLVV